jgi:hypothetical protein
LTSAEGAFSFLDRLDLATLAWLLAAAFALHEAEEWNIHRWYQRNFVDLPGDRTNSTIRLFLVLITVTGILWTGLAVVWGSPKAAAFILLPFASLLFQNALQHIYWQSLSREYAPGLASAVALLLPGSIALAFKAVREGDVGIWYPVILGALAVAGLVQTVRQRNRLAPALLVSHRICVRLLGRLGLPNR